jgi:hypothetical protein
MKYLLIENRCETIPSVDYLVSLGSTTSRGDENKIGMFGSGTVYAIALLARKGMLDKTKICLGKTVFTGEVYSKELTDSRGNVNNEEFIRLKQQNGPTYNLNLSVKFGGVEWNKAEYALREFISNACDGAESFDGTYSTVRIESKMIESPTILRAKDGFVRVYVPITNEVEDYVDNIHDYFICLKPQYNNTIEIYPNIWGGPAKIYRKGVLVGQLGEKSLFHYNLSNIDLKESRVVDSYEAKSKAAKALYTCKNQKIYEKFLEEIVVGNHADDYWESSFEAYYLSPDSYYNSEDVQKPIDDTWQSATQKIIGDSILCENELTSTIVARKGYNPIRVDNTYHRLLKSARMKTVADILNIHEIAGREVIPASQNTLEVFNKVWQHLEKLEMLAGKSKPKVMCYHSNNMCEDPYGYYKDETCFIRSDISEDKGECLTNVMLEEIAHFITNAHDHTREFQEFAFKVATKSMLQTNTSQG